MILPALLFLAQTLPADIAAPPEKTTQPVRHHHGHPVPTPTLHVRTTIVNATCVPSLSLSTSGTNAPPAYPSFPQGEWTANEARTNAEVHYTVRTPAGIPVADRVIRYAPLSSQFLLLTGDLSRRGPADKLPQVVPLTGAAPVPWPPNFQFHVYPVELVTKDPCHYRVVNGIPGKTLTLRTRPGAGKPSRPLGILAPGNSMLFTSQPACIDWIAEIDGVSLPVSVVQEGAVGNCLIPFFLKGGKPAFVRVFEAP